MPLRKEKMSLHSRLRSSAEEAAKKTARNAPVSPEGAPADEALAEVLVRRGLLDEKLDLVRHREGRVAEVRPRELAVDPLDHGARVLVQHLRVHDAR